MHKVVLQPKQHIHELTDQQTDILLCRHLGDVWPCGILQIIHAMQKQDRQVQLRFTLALQILIVDQTAPSSSLIHLHRVLFGMTAKHCKEAALKAIGVVDADGYLVEKPEFQGGRGNGDRSAGHSHA